MGRGLGPTQRALLEYLDEAETREAPPGRVAPAFVTVAELSEVVGRSNRQVLTAIRALEARDLVKVGRGELRGEPTGRLATRRPIRGGLVGTSEPVVIRKGEPWPYKPGYVAAEDVTMYHAWRAVHGLVVASVAVLERRLELREERRAETH
ncbi:hypothetical protein [Nocardioides panzhihuensis]|uniref:Uncharacterized protein n=1 Tax=Nocardioides panzhihuensis TaxID=860243 RepID=A0A7Z0DP00_9ACTN|nr:hypothetical protein [Nocardioides panzhihuensis]NYI78736.1 hypothetical protein [Nocardioides panzhihuensis]